MRIMRLKGIRLVRFQIAINGQFIELVSHFIFQDVISVMKSWLIDITNELYQLAYGDLRYKLLITLQKANTRETKVKLYEALQAHVLTYEWDTDGAKTWLCVHVYTIGWGEVLETTTYNVVASTIGSKIKNRFELVYVICVTELHRSHLTGNSIGYRENDWKLFDKSGIKPVTKEEDTYAKEGGTIEDGTGCKPTSWRTQEEKDEAQNDAM